MNKFAGLCLSLLCLTTARAQQGVWQGKFEQLGSELPTPTSQRAADGAPGPAYWQQKADYELTIVLDEEDLKISGRGQITYTNNSPHGLNYLWLQLDQNRRSQDNQEAQTANFSIPDSIMGKHWMYYLKWRSRLGGMHITSLKTDAGHDLSYHIEHTMMRVDLPQPLKSGQKISFTVAWWYHLNNRMEDAGRSGLEYFPEDDNYVFTIAQFYPRMAVYDDLEGWQHKQFLGAGEFALTFGDYDVKISVPADHLLMATGNLQNARDVLTKTQLRRLQQARASFEKPILIATETEARSRESIKEGALKTWHFKAEKVRDFAFATSRKFIWDAQAVQLGSTTVMAQSLYPKEGNPLWEQESTKAVVNTLKTYSKYTFDYPYPVATSIHAANIGMEYPMICFNFGRPRKDGSFSEATRFAMIGVVIHEVGHNFFPMIVNSDERQWTWMDEGLNSFLQFRTEKECYNDFPSRRGPAKTIVPYMRLDKDQIRPIMTNSEQVLQLGNNAYGKPATALNILRETILGPDLFDFAFKTYAYRWAFKHPKPADFFRSMEDATGVDLDWFWRGWFYTTDHVDQSIDTVIWHREIGADLPHLDDPPSSVTQKDLVHDFILLDTPGPYYGEFRGRLDEEKIRNKLRQKYIYEVRVNNLGGLVMPLLFVFEMLDGSLEKIQIPAEVWRKNEVAVHKVFLFDQPVIKVGLDPENDIGDTDLSNNVFPRQPKVSKFKKFKKTKSDP